MTKILHMWLADAPNRGGGGAGSMYRLHSNLKKKGIDSSILCEFNATDDPNVFTKPTLNRFESMIGKITSRVGLNDIHRISSFNIKKHEAFIEADLLHLHGIHSGFISYLALPALSRNKPTVFTLRDLWALTGHCAFSYDCERWKTGCGNCPYPQNYPPIKRDVTKLEWKLKNWAYSRSKITIVTLSKWLADQAKQSMLNHFEIVQIPNGIDTTIYQPLDQRKVRDVLGIPQKRYVLMFTAIGLSSHHKGGDLLLEALKKLPQSLKKETTLLLVGNNGGQLARAAEIEAVNLGYLSSEILKTIAFSAADLFVFPSRAESFGQVILESMACGTPVVSQKIGPIPELVRSGVTGYLAEAENSNDFCHGIVQLLEDTVAREKMGRNCRKIAVEEYPVRLEVQRYIDLYSKILNS